MSPNPANSFPTLIAPRRAGTTTSRWGLGVLSILLMTMVLPAQAEGFLARLLGQIKSLHMEVSSGRQSLVIKARGSLTVNPAETDLAIVTDWVFIEERRDGERRSMTFRAVPTSSAAEGSAQGGANNRPAGSEIRRVWNVNGQERAMDDEARQWLARVLPKVLRETGLQREARVQRLMASGGVDAVMAEIALIETAHARKRYVQSLLGLGPLADKHFAPLLKLVDAMDGDFEKRGALVALCTSQTLQPVQQVAVLESIGRMDSDFEKRSALAGLVPRLVTTAAVQTAWVNVLRGFSSDFERRESIALLVRQTQAGIADLALQSVLQIDSDFERGQALAMTLRRMPSPTPAQLTAAVDAIRGMQSAFEQRNAIAAVLKRGEPDRATAQAILRVIDGMHGSHEQRESLVMLARNLPKDAAVIESYRAAARQLPEHERVDAERALARRL